eukprot:SAG31_NODE_35675_length_320_cov_160.574661_1_plen_71_part_01
MCVGMVQIYRILGISRYSAARGEKKARAAVGDGALLMLRSQERQGGCQDLETPTRVDSKNGGGERAWLIGV